MKQFFSVIAPKSMDHLLDIGGAAHTWVADAGEGHFPVTLINLRFGSGSGDKRFTYMVGDATNLPFAERAFDIAYSNSVIEHVGSFEKQRAFANEARRVAHKIWIQTPARSFPIEAHLLAPYIQYLPRKVQHWLVPLTVRGMINRKVAHQCVDEVRLLTLREFKGLFPDCRILKERILGITKSYIAVRL